MNKPEGIKPEGMDFGFLVWAMERGFLCSNVASPSPSSALVARHTSLGKLILLGGMMGIGTLYVWWAKSGGYRGPNHTCAYLCLPVASDGRQNAQAVGPEPRPRQSVFRTVDSTSK